MNLTWRCRDRNLTGRDRPWIMGILNCTPDSFSDGGRFDDPAAAVRHGLDMVAAGADIIDVGGESTRPGAAPVDPAEEIRRVMPVIEALARESDVLLSIDTTKAVVARAALEAGAHIINDVSALTRDPASVTLAKQYGAGVVLMHMQGTPRTMQTAPVYTDVVAEVAAYLAARAAAAEAAGVARETIAVDPGIGFGKTVAHNLALLGNLGALTALGRPVLVGLSRKRFIGALTGAGVEGRLAGSLAGALAAARQGAAVLRVHDVAATVEALTVARALDGAAREDGMTA